MPAPRIVITGMGIVSALGWTPDETWDALAAERTGLGALTLFDSPRCGHVLVGELQADPARRSGLAHGSRTDHLAVCAARSAWSAASLDAASDHVRANAGVVLGTTTGGMLDSEVFLRQLIEQHTMDVRLVRHHDCACPTMAVAHALGLGGHQATVSTACSSGSIAIAAACDVLAAGEADLVLAGGVDSLTRLTLNGFSSLMCVAPDGCRPFDVGRTGMSLGEGAAVLVLEREETARARGATPLADVAGFGITCDAHHATAPSPDGRGAIRAMSLALERAGVAPRDVDYINAHGTGTPYNDEVEATAIHRVFGADVPLVSSTKGFSGHTLAAAGAIETVVCVLALQRQAVPANLGLDSPDPSFAFEPVRRTREARVRVAVNNSFGFGGNNCSLVIRSVEPT